MHISFSVSMVHMPCLLYMCMGTYHFGLRAYYVRIEICILCHLPCASQHVHVCLYIIIVQTIDLLSMATVSHYWSFTPVSRLFPSYCCGSSMYMNLVIEGKCLHVVGCICNENKWSQHSILILPAILHVHMQLHICTYVYTYNVHFVLLFHLCYICMYIHDVHTHCYVYIVERLMKDANTGTSYLECLERGQFFYNRQNGSLQCHYLKALLQYHNYWSVLFFARHHKSVWIVPVCSMD